MVDTPRLTGALAHSHGPRTHRQGLQAAAAAVRKLLSNLGPLLTHSPFNYFISTTVSSSLKKGHII